MKTPKNNHEDGKRQAGMSRSAKAAAFVCSLLGALLLWIYAIGYDSTLFDRTFSGVEVEIRGEDALSLDKGYTLAEKQSFSSITIVAKGKRSELNELTAEDFKAVVDVSKAQKAGDQDLPITVIAPNGIEVVSQSSSTVMVFVDEFTQRNDLLSVKVDTGDNYVMTEGVTFVSAVANPLSVTVSGAKSVLERVEGAYVNFNLDGYEISESISGYGKIELRDKDGKVIDNPYISISDSTAYVSIAVKKQKVIPVRVAFVGGVYDIKDIATTVSAQTVTVSGAPEALAAINELVLEIDETEVDGTQVFEFSIGAALPSGVTNESGVSKISVTVKMPELSVRSYTISKENIFVKNLPEGYTFEIKNDLSVTLIGPRDAFENFDHKLMTAYLNYDRVTVGDDGGYTAEATVDFGGEYPGIYVQSKNYNVEFSVVAPSLPPVEPNEPVDPNEVIDTIDPNEVMDNENS